MERPLIRNLFLLFLIFTFWSEGGSHAFADTPFVVNQNAEKFLDSLMEDDAHSYFSGYKSLINWGHETSPFVRVTAEKYFDDYQANGLSANQEYLNKQVEITGQIGSVNADDPDSPYVAVVTSNPILTVNAYINSAGMNEAAKYVAGKPVTLFCTGAGVLLTFPQLNNCYGDDVFFQTLNSGIESSIDNWLNGKDKGFPYKIPEQAEKLMVLFYFAAGNITDQSPCKSLSPSQSCMSWLAQYIKSHKSAVDAEYSEYHTYLGVQ